MSNFTSQNISTNLVFLTINLECFTQMPSQRCSAQQFQSLVNKFWCILVSCTNRRNSLCAEQLIFYTSFHYLRASWHLMKLFAKGTLLSLATDLFEYPGICQIDLKLHYITGTQCQLFTGPPFLSLATAPSISPSLHFRAHESLRNEL